MDLFGKKKIRALETILNNTIQSNIALEKISKTLTCLNELIIEDNEKLKNENENLKEEIYKLTEIKNDLQYKLDACIKLENVKKSKKSSKKKSKK